MLLTPLRLILLRCYNVTLGRFEWGERLFRQSLERLVVWRRPPQDRYTASAGFFDIRELESDSGTPRQEPKS